MWIAGAETAGVLSSGRVGALAWIAGAEAAGWDHGRYARIVHRVPIRVEIACRVRLRVGFC